YVHPASRIMIIKYAGLNSPARRPGPSGWGERLRLARGLEHGGVERLARRLAGPDHELERWIISFAGVERGREQRLALPAGGLDAPGEQQRVPVHDQAVLDPEIEMPDPHLLVDQRGELLHLGAAAFWGLELERAGEMQRLDVVHPGERDLVVGP